MPCYTMELITTDDCHHSSVIDIFSAESFGTLLQKYTPVSSMTPTSIDDVLSGLPDTGHSQGSVTSPDKSPTNEVLLV